VMKIPLKVTTDDDVRHALGNEIRDNILKSSPSSTNNRESDSECNTENTPEVRRDMTEKEPEIVIVNESVLIANLNHETY
jgi:hypothetical protein